MTTGIALIRQEDGKQLAMVVKMVDGEEFEADDMETLLKAGDFRVQGCIVVEYTFTRLLYAQAYGFDVQDVDTWQTKVQYVGDELTDSGDTIADVEGRGGELSTDNSE